LDELFEKARSKLTETEKKKDYEEILRGLILECMYILSEKKVAIRCKKSDQDKVKSAAKKAAAEYKEKMGSEVEAVIDEKNYLPDESAGGVSLVGGGGKIELNNTLEERLKMCETEALPSIRATLFGKNENRKFHD